MTELCFAEFAKCLQSAMQPPNDDKDVIELLLGWITDMPSVLDKKGKVSKGTMMIFFAFSRRSICRG